MYLNLDMMRKTILLNLLNYDLRFDIVFALRFDHYPDLIPISIGKNIFRIRINRFKRARLEKGSSFRTDVSYFMLFFLSVLSPRRSWFQIDLYIPFDRPLNRLCLILFVFCKSAPSIFAQMSACMPTVYWPQIHSI